MSLMVMPLTNFTLLPSIGHIE